MLESRSGGSDHEPGIVTLRVVVPGASEQSTIPKHRLRFEHSTLAEHSVYPHIPEHRERIVEQHSGRQPPTRDPISTMYGKDELQGPHEVWRNPLERAPFAIRFQYEPNLALFEIA